MRGTMQNSVPKRFRRLAAWVLVSTTTLGSFFQLSRETSSRSFARASSRLHSSVHSRPTAAGKVAAKPSAGNLIFDPVLAYATFLGGPNFSPVLQEATALIVDANGNAYVAGNTTSTNFPTTAGVVQPSSPTLNGGTFVSKIDPTGKTLIFSTYVPGLVQLTALAVDASGNIYVAGSAGNLTIPAGTTPFQGAPRSIGIVKLNSGATAILNATYLGGSGNDGVTGVAVDAAGDLYLTGFTNSNDFPTLNPLQGSLGTSGENAFVTKMNSSLSALAYSTYLGGNSNSGTTIGSIAVDSAMDSYVVGSAGAGFPTTAGAIMNTCSGCGGFLSKLNPSGSSLLYSTYLGLDYASSVVVDSQQDAYVGGATSSAMSTLNSCSASTGGFVAEITPAGAVPFSACFGSLQTPIDRGVTGLALDVSGNLYVVGSGAGGLTLKNPIQTNPSGVTSFVAAVNPSTNSLLFSSLIGGGAQSAEADAVTGVGVDSNGNIYAAGGAWNQQVGSSSNPPPPFPVFNALQPVPGAIAPGEGHCTTCVTSDAFLLKIAPTNAPAAALNPALLSFPTQAVGTSSAPQAVTIFDLGSAPLAVSNVTVTGDFSIQNNCGTLTPAGGTCAINVTYSPTTTGAQSGTLTITDDSAGSPRTVQLAGQGGQAAATLSPTSLTFPSQAPGTTSAAQTITLNNIGAIALNVESVQISGPFGETNTCGNSVAANGSCTINVTFSPTTNGPASGTLTIMDSAPGSPQTVTLSGTGGAQATAMFSPTSLTFPNQPPGTTSAAQTVTLSNAGALALTVSSVQVSGPFSESNNCSNSVAVDSSCTFNVTFSPTANGPATGTLTIRDSAPNSPQTVSLSGIGGAQSLGLSIATGGSSSATVIAGSTASYTLSIGGAGMAGTASLSCTGAPSGATCSAPATVMVSATGSSTFMASVSTTARSNILLPPRDPTPWLWVLGILAWAAIFGAAPALRFSRLRWAFVPALALILVACGGSYGNNTTSFGTPAGTYTIVVTAKSGSTMQTQNLTLTVQ
jgi:hypothetical protein